MKKLMIVLLILAAAGVAAYFMTPSAEDIVKTVVHKYGSQVTGTEVNLGGFRLDIFNGEVEVKTDGGQSAELQSAEYYECRTGCG